MYEQLSMSDPAVQDFDDGVPAKVPGSNLLREFCFYGRRSSSTAVPGIGGKRLVTTVGAHSLKISFFDSGVLITTTSSDSELRQRSCLEEFCCIGPPSSSFASSQYSWHFIKRNTIRDVHVNCQEVQANKQRQLQSKIDFFLFQDFFSVLDGTPTSFTVALDPVASADFFTFAQGYMLTRKWESEVIMNQHSVLAIQAGANLQDIQQVQENAKTAK